MSTGKNLESPIMETCVPGKSEQIWELNVLDMSKQKPPHENMAIQHD